MSDHLPTGTREFPPMYNPTGDVPKDRLAFFHLIEKVKVLDLSTRSGLFSCESRNKSAQDGSTTTWVCYRESRSYILLTTAERSQIRRGTCTYVGVAFLDVDPWPVSISDHMYRMAVLAMCSSDRNLNISKCGASSVPLFSFDVVQDV